VAYAADFGAAVEAVKDEAKDGDLILTLGAGSVSQLAPQILAAIEADWKAAVEVVDAHRES